MQANPALPPLVRTDSRLRDMAMIAAAFVIFPLLLAVKDHGADFLPQYWSAMLGAFSWPLIVLFTLSGRVP